MHSVRATRGFRNMHCASSFPLFYHLWQVACGRQVSAGESLFEQANIDCVVHSGSDVRLCGTDLYRRSPALAPPVGGLVLVVWETALGHPVTVRRPTVRLRTLNKVKSSSRYIDFYSFETCETAQAAHCGTLSEDALTDIEHESINNSCRRATCAA